MERALNSVLLCSSVPDKCTLQPPSKAFLGQGLKSQRISKSHKQLQSVSDRAMRSLPVSSIMTRSNHIHDFIVKYSVAREKEKQGVRGSL